MEINKGGVVQNYQQKYLYIRLFYFQIFYHINSAIQIQSLLFPDKYKLVKSPQRMAHKNEV